VLKIKYCCEECKRKWSLSNCDLEANTAKCVCKCGKPINKSKTRKLLVFKSLNR
jgi:PHP family Zn ribbon phosphoesterase